VTIAAVATIGTGTSNVSGTSLVLTTTAAAEAGNLVILAIAKDNTSTTDQETNEVTYVTDSAGNNGWRKLGEYCNGQGSAAAGCVISLWSCRLANTIASSGTITITMVTTTAKVCSAYEFTCSAENRWLDTAGTLQTGATDAAEVPSLSVTGLTSREYLFVRATAYENSSLSIATPTSGWTAIGSATIGSGAAGMSVDAEFKIATATSATSQQGSSGAVDNASVLVALYEAMPPAVLGMGAVF